MKSALQRFLRPNVVDRVIQTCFHVTKIAIQRIAKHLNTTLDSAQLCRAVKLFDAKYKLFAKDRNFLPEIVRYVRTL